MRLIIDCFKLVKGAGKSIGIYNLAVNLVRELAADGGTQELIVLGNAYNRADFDREGIRFVEIKRNPLNKLGCIFWELFAVSVTARKLKADKVLFPRGYASIFHLTKECVIIHDMIPFYYHEHFPGYFNRLENFYIMWRLKASARRADQVITISEASKRDILKYSHTAADRITVIYNGYNAIESPQCGEAEEPYILAMTSGLPHKNAIGIVKSYAAYCRLTEKPVPLRIIGIKDVSRFGLEQDVLANITCTGYVEEDAQLHRMIYAAKAFLFLSLAEGFGFPPIEAMQLGTPVICSDRSSLPEVVAEAAVCVDPEDYDRVAEAIQGVVDNVIDTDELCRRGKANAARFDWEKTGRRYREVLFEWN
ncbi:MAG: glycosyltransferase family 4 protein [Roseburia sp.]|nr:glycosyltransferase family 4 protein [Roseburia sp.]